MITRTLFLSFSADVPRHPFLLPPVAGWAVGAAVRAHRSVTLIPSGAFAHQVMWPVLWGITRPDLKRGQPRTLTLTIAPSSARFAILRQHCEGSGMERVLADPIPFLVCLGVALLLVWLWRRFRGQ